MQIIEIKKYKIEITEEEKKQYSEWANKLAEIRDTLFENPDYFVSCCEENVIFEDDFDKIIHFLYELSDGSVYFKEA